jgi:choline dehydrogenase-like flavoprotein
LQLGFCGQGCKSGAKWSTLYSEIPKAEATGRLELRPNCMVIRLEHDRHDRVTGVLYIDAGGKQQFQKAAMVALAGNAIESARLLLNSASARYPAGLANRSGWVGRGYMRHLNASAWGQFDRPVHMNHGVAMGGTIYDESRLDPEGWGDEFSQFIEGYDHVAGIWMNGEDLSRADNRVTLHPTEKDAHGLAIPNVHVDEHPNDLAMRAHFRRRAEAVLRAAGARSVIQGAQLPASHNLGTCRMSANRETGVTNAYGQSHDLANLFIADGSLFPSSSSANPTLTIVALAIRQAHHMARLLG